MKRQSKVPPTPKTEEGAGGRESDFASPVSLLRMGQRRYVVEWNDGMARPVALAELGEHYRRYRLGDPAAEESMGGCCVAGFNWHPW